MHPYSGRGPEAGAGWDDELKLANRAIDLATNHIAMVRWERASGFDIRPIASFGGSFRRYAKVC